MRATGRALKRTVAGEEIATFVPYRGKVKGTSWNGLHNDPPLDGHALPEAQWSGFIAASSLGK
jgi:hypothetical protein